MKKTFTLLLLVASFISAHAIRATYDFNADAIGTTIPMSGGEGSATVVSNPYGQGNVVEVISGGYNFVPVYDITLPDDITLGDCGDVSIKFYIPSANNEQYANYKQILIYIDGTLVFKNTNASGEDEYPKQGEKDTWITKSFSLSSMNLTDEIKNASTIQLGIGLNDDKMKYYVSEIDISYSRNLDDPVIPEKGAYYTGKYRNLFAEAGYTDAQIQSRIDDLWATYFEGNEDTERLYYESGSDMAYILDVNNNDVRTEGMSYGMMICVQLDRQQEFDALWKWAKTYMQYPENHEARGYFAWQCSTDGGKKGNTPASDGEEYFATALLFASSRWGDGEGIFNYSAEADYILKMCIENPNKESNPYSSFTPLFDLDPSVMQVVFVPYASSALFTDPSYHLPAFYEIWAKRAAEYNDTYTALAAKSREMFPKFANKTTGLMPDYANFDGSAHLGDGDHAGFYYDAWRCIMNMAIDFAWFKPAGNPYQELITRQLNFFRSKGITEYHSLYELDGSDKNGNTDHSPGLVACNASGVLASTNKADYQFIDNFFDTAIPTGRYRYYDGCLYFLNWLNCAGRYQAFNQLATTAIDNVTCNELSLRLSDNSIVVAPAVENATYTVINLTSGITVASGALNGSVIDLEAVAAGIYAVKVTTPDENKTMKFIKH